MYQLHLNAPNVADEAFLWHPSNALLNGQWECTVRMDFNPSASNYATIHLAEDNNSGYYLKLGGADDAISLCKHNNGSSSKIIESPEDFLDLDSVLVRIQVLRDSIGNWELLVDTALNGNYFSLGTVFDDTYLSSSQFGLQCSYTQTRSDKFYFDNISVSGTAFLDTFQLPQPKQLLLNELMIDPSPANDLPEAEYLELLNNSPHTFNLKHLQIADASSQSNLPHYFLAPKETVILCDDLEDFPSIQAAIALNLPSLNNASDSIQLWLHDSILIDAVYYKDDWHTVDTEGGVSLELINPYSACSSKNNWASSTHPTGGTPAQINSVFDTIADNTPPQILSMSWQSDTLSILLDETSEISTSSIGLLEGNGTNWHVYFNPALATNKAHNITLIDVKDCEGNTHSIQLEFIVPAIVETGDVLINEILFNPIEGDNDFIEIYNHSDKFIDLNNWALANQYADTIANTKTISDSSFIIYPKEIWVLCKDAQTLLHYHPTAIVHQIIELQSLPAYNNDAGSVYLLAKDKLIDAFHYSEELHFDLLHSVDGVSLERISPNANQWHSASENAGFATPTLVNSQNNESPLNSEPLALSPKIFSPNNDGEDDLLQIQINLTENGYAGSVHIFNAQGIHINTIANNVLFGTNNTFYWDGLNSQGLKAPIGRYIVLLSAFNTNGKIVNTKKTCVLGGQL